MLRGGTECRNGCVALNAPHIRFKCVRLDKKTKQKKQTNRKSTTFYRSSVWKCARISRDSTRKKKSKKWERRVSPGSRTSYALQGGQSVRGGVCVKAPKTSYAQGSPRAGRSGIALSGKQEESYTCVDIYVYSNI